MADLNLQLRVRITETGGASGVSTDDYELYYSKNQTAYAAVAAGQSVEPYNSPNMAEGDATTNRLTSTNFSAGKVSEDGEVNDLTIPASGSTELLFPINLRSDLLADGDTLDFKVYRNGSPIDTYTTIPRITVAAILPTGPTNIIIENIGLSGPFSPFRGLGD